jgi:hypothetical protein
MCRFDGMPARSGPIGAQEGSVHVRSISDPSCDLHGERATLLRKTIFEDEGRRVCTRLGPSRIPLRQARSALHLSPSKEHDLRTRRPSGPAITGNNNTKLRAFAELASAPTARQSLQQ